MKKLKMLKKGALLVIAFILMAGSVFAVSGNVSAKVFNHAGIVRLLSL